MKRYRHAVDSFGEAVVWEENAMAKKTCYEVRYGREVMAVLSTAKSARAYVAKFDNPFDRIVRVTVEDVPLKPREKAVRK